MGSVYNQTVTGASAESDEEEAGPSNGSGVCKWFNVRMGFGFLSMSSRDGAPLQQPLDVFVHQSKLHMEGFRSLREGEAVEFTFKKSSKGLESLRVTGPNGASCLGSERRPKGAKKRQSKGDRCYNCGGSGHHAKECQLPPLPRRCHFCQSVSHMVANCPLKAQQQHEQQQQQQQQQQEQQQQQQQQQQQAQQQQQEQQQQEQQQQEQQQQEQQQQEQQQQEQQQSFPGSQGTATSLREEQSHTSLSESSE